MSGQKLIALAYLTIILEISCAKVYVWKESRNDEISPYRWRRQTHLGATLARIQPANVDTGVFTPIVSPSFGQAQFNQRVNTLDTVDSSDTLIDYLVPPNPNVQHSTLNFQEPALNLQTVASTGIFEASPSNVDSQRQTFQNFQTTPSSVQNQIHFPFSIPQTTANQGQGFQNLPSFTTPSPSPTAKSEIDQTVHGKWDLGFEAGAILVPPQHGDFSGKAEYDTINGNRRPVGSIYNNDGQFGAGGKDFSASSISITSNNNRDNFQNSNVVWGSPKATPSTTTTPPPFLPTIPPGQQNSFGSNQQGTFNQQPSPASGNGILFNNNLNSNAGTTLHHAFHQQRGTSFAPPKTVLSNSNSNSNEFNGNVFSNGQSKQFGKNFNLNSNNNNNNVPLNGGGGSGSGSGSEGFKVPFQVGGVIQQQNPFEGQFAGGIGNGQPSPAANGPFSFNNQNSQFIPNHPSSNNNQNSQFVAGQFANFNQGLGAGQGQFSKFIPPPTQTSQNGGQSFGQFNVVAAASPNGPILLQYPPETGAFPGSGGGQFDIASGLSQGTVSDHSAFPFADSFRRFQKRQASRQETSDEEESTGGKEEEMEEYNARPSAAVYSFVKTDPDGHFKWSVRHNARR